MNPDLSQLRDIHLPDPVSWWPLALGWWLLLGLVVVATVGVLWWWRHRRNTRWRRAALTELTRISAALATRQETAHACVVALSVLLRRVAISQFPRNEVAALNGDAWLAFLDRSFGAGSEFASGVGRTLTTAPYSQTTKVDTETLQTLFDLSKRWIKKLPTGGAR